MKDDEEEKIGTIVLTREQKAAINKIVSAPEWAAVENWARQRQTKIAVLGISAAQTFEGFNQYKGMAVESRTTILSLRKISQDYKTSVEKKQ